MIPPAGFQWHLGIYLVMTRKVVRSVHIAVFSMLRRVAVLFALLYEPGGTSLLEIDLHLFGDDGWVHVFPYQRRGYKPCIVPDDLPDFVAKLWMVCYSPEHLDVQRVG
jgi:hypothetical protein